MLRALRVICAATPVLLLCAQEPGQKAKLTAREMFFADRDEKAARPAGTNNAGQAGTRKGRKPVGTKATSPEAANDQKAVPVASSAPPAEESPAPEPVRSGSSNIVQAAHAAVAPLGLRYSVLKIVDGEGIETPPDTTFRSGDRIQVKVEANDNGYLYIVHQGSSGKWNVMFPSPNIENGNNRVEKHRSYVLPPGNVFTFVGEPGKEKLFLLISRQPEPDLQALIYSLKRTADGNDDPRAKPPENAVLASAAPLPNSTVDLLRRAYSRDLITEKVDVVAPGEKPDNAVYIVNPSGRVDSRVVADVELTHQ